MAKEPLLGSKEFGLIVVAVVIVSIGLVFWGKDNSPISKAVINPVEKTTVEQQTDTNLGLLERNLETKLQTTLSKMSGVGQVQVTVSLASGLKSDYARNENVTKRTSKETDQQSGTRETTEVIEDNQVVMPNGSTQPVMVMEERPDVAGVLIIAEGAKDPKVKESIHNAVMTLLNIPAKNITVEPMGGQ